MGDTKSHESPGLDTNDCLSLIEITGERVWSFFCNSSCDFMCQHGRAMGCPGAMNGCLCPPKMCMWKP